MKKWLQLGYLALLGFVGINASVSFADTSSNGDDQQVEQFLYNLGQYLGFNLCKYPASTDGCSNFSPSSGLSQTLLNLTNTQLIESYLVNSVLGALPVNTSGATQFLPSSVSSASQINNLANFVYSSTPYSSPNAQQITVNALIDQQTYQADPISQAVLNILGTPDVSNCIGNDNSVLSVCDPSKSSSNNTNPISRNEYQVMLNVLGKLPDTDSYFTYSNIQPILSELNTNSLIAPLLYSTDSSSGNGGGSNSGLIAQNQAQQAANFIRYASGMVAPLPLPNRKDYDNVYSRTLSSNTNALDRVAAIGILANYLTSLRVYAAQASVGISNLYYMLQKRMPQNFPTGSGSSTTPTSQALNEFNMATWRLYNPDNSPNTQWIQQINQASTATVQKEIVTLLAEINYQLYLTRQQQERLLLTNTMLLIQNSHEAQPANTLTDVSISAPNKASTPASTSSGSQ